MSKTSGTSGIGGVKPTSGTGGVKPISKPESKFWIIRILKRIFKSK